MWVTQGEWITQAFIERAMQELDASSIKWPLPVELSTDVTLLRMHEARLEKEH